MTAPIVLTPGDPSGVGLEISFKAWANRSNDAPFFLLADHRYMADLSSQFGIPWVAIQSPEQTIDAFDTGLPVLHHSFAQAPKTGQSQPANAPSVVSSIETAVKMVNDNRALAICTNPINKKILQDGANFPYPGHTEFLAYLGGVKTSVMMLVAPELKVVPVTIHIALDHVARTLTPELLETTIRIVVQSLQQDFNIPQPRLSIAGLNPHAGETGAMGDEEINWINDLVKRLIGKGFHLSGPKSADTMFHAKARQHYDAAICMYHDQALIPIKTINFSGGVNCTLGLPFIRTSPDHGTAFDIAGQGIADPSSLIEALSMAAKMAKNRQDTHDK